MQKLRQNKDASVIAFAGTRTTAHTTTMATRPTVTTARIATHRVSPYPLVGGTRDAPLTTTAVRLPSLRIAPTHPPRFYSSSTSSTQRSASRVGDRSESPQRIARPGGSLAVLGVASPGRACGLPRLPPIPLACVRVAEGGQGPPNRRGFCGYAYASLKAEAAPEFDAAWSVAARLRFPLRQ